MRKKREKTNVSLSHIFSNQKETVNWVPPPVFACARALRVHVCGFEPGSALYARRSDVAGEGRRGHPGWTTVRRGGQLQRRFENGTETGEIRIETKPKLTFFLWTQLVDIRESFHRRCIAVLPTANVLFTFPSIVRSLFLVVYVCGRRS